MMFRETLTTIEFMIFKKTNVNKINQVCKESNLYKLDTRKLRLKTKSFSFRTKNLKNNDF